MAQNPKKVAFALQGGGSHGAFTWGVMDCFLQEPRLKIEGISGTSAGGMIGAAILQGMAKNKEAGASEELKRYFTEVNTISKKIGLIPNIFDRFFKKDGFLSFSHPLLTLATFMPSPSTWNPTGINLLENMLNKFFEFDMMKDFQELKLFLTATEVRSSKVRIFSNKNLSPKVLMASACLPQLFKAVEVDGEYYWDGGYIGNPSIFPLINNCEATDIFLVLLTPRKRADVPKTAAEIATREIELRWNNTLVREMRNINFITKLIEEGSIKQDRLKKVNIHVIENIDFFSSFPASGLSCFNNDWDFLQKLYKAGFATAQTWLKQNFEAIGQRTTFDIEKNFVTSFYE